MPRLPALLVALLLAGPALGADEPFVGLDFDAAATKAKATGKLLFVDVFAEGHAPCEQKEAPMWRDAAVRTWMSEHAIAIQLDAHTTQGPVEDFNIEDFPTIILLREGTELDRHTGCMEAAELMAWIENALAGRTENAAVAARTRAALTSDDFQVRGDAEFDAVGRHDDDVARQHLLWLWQHSDHDVEWAELRAGYLPMEMAKVARRNETARKDFLEILDKADAKVQAEPGLPEASRWQEWFALCAGLDQIGRVVAWYEKHRDEEGQLFADEPASAELARMRELVFEALITVDRPVEAVRLFPDSRGLLEQRMTGYVGWTKPDLLLMSEDEHGQILTGLDEAMRSDFAIMYAGLLGADRTEEAEQWAAALLGALDDAESRVALVRAALQHPAARPAQLGVWLDEAEARGADVKELRAKLAESAKGAK